MFDNRSSKIHCKKIQRVLWHDVRKNFMAVNEKLVHIIDLIDPGKNLPLIKTTFPFGGRILLNGKLHLFEEVKNNPELAKPLKPQDVIDSLNYAPVPFGVFLNKACETFIDLQGRIIPSFVLRAGDTIGLFETLDFICGATSNPIWNVTAGARSIFMLAKINNSLWHKRLARHFNISTSTPTNLENHWHVFAALANAKSAKTDWYCDLVFFPKCWLQHLSTEATGWSQLREYLFKECWLQASPMIEKSFSLLWQQFSMSTIRRNYKPRIYITDTIRHLMGVVSGQVPAFAPAYNEESAPIQLIKTAYHDIYDLPYSPTLMEPTCIRHGHPFVYYSLGYPTMLEGDPEITNIYNTISDLKEIKILIENMHHYCQNYTGDTQGLAAMLKKVSFAYFHKAQDRHNEIYESARLPEIDKNFCEPSKNFANKKFCATAPFFNGCIQIKNTFLG